MSWCADIPGPANFSEALDDPCGRIGLPEQEADTCGLRESVMIVVPALTGPIDLKPPVSYS